MTTTIHVYCRIYSEIQFFIILYMSKYESEINQVHVHVFVMIYSYFYTIRQYSYVYCT